MSRSTRVPKAPRDQLDRLVEAEAKLDRADARRAAIGDQVVDLEVAVGARRDHRAQVRRRVAQQVRQRIAGRRRQPIGLVDDQDDVERRLRDFGEPDRHPLEPGRRRGLEQRVAEGGAAGGGADRHRQALHETRWVVVRLRRHPGHHPALRQVLAPPLGEQRRLAVARRRLHQDHRVAAQAFVVGPETWPGDLVAWHARRRDLQQEVIGDTSKAARG